MGYIHSRFLDLVRSGVGFTESAQIAIDSQNDWDTIQSIANQQGLSAIVLDGMETLRQRGALGAMPEKMFLMQWLGEVLQSENDSAVQHKTARKMARLFHENGMRTYVLKGEVISECYPKPIHRWCDDLDCILKAEGAFDAWSLGNDIIKEQGFEVSTDFYKNSTFYLPGLMVENHRYMTPFRGNRRLEALEKLMQEMLGADDGKDMFEGTQLYRPPVLLSAIFFIEHAYSHFLHNGLTWRHVLDWVMFSRKHKEEIDWLLLDSMIDEFGFRKFYDSYDRIGRYLSGELAEGHLLKADKKMLDDVWADIRLAESFHGVKAKITFAMNTLRAGWKYRYFSDISMIHALWIQVKGFLFIKEPALR